jgi:hypothetical protein
MDDLFTADQPDESTIRQEIEQKWKEKFPDAPAELLEAKINSDLYIKTLERQKDELRIDFMKAQEQIQSSANLQELIDRLNQKTAPEALTPKPDETPGKPEPIDFDKLFEQKYEQKKRADQELSNFNRVQQKLQERFGHNAGSVLQEQAQSLGLSKEDVNSLAKKSPDAFFRMLGLDQQKEDLFMAPPRSDVRRDLFAPKATKRDWNFYQDLKKKNPTEYWAPKTQLQMHRDAEALGDAFGVD